MNIEHNVAYVLCIYMLYKPPHLLENSIYAMF